MLEIPKHLADLFHRLLYDFDYFEYALLNGGWAGLIGVLFLILMIRSARRT
jgi:hypothetical protein